MGIKGVKKNKTFENEQSQKIFNLLEKKIDHSFNKIEENTVLSVHVSALEEMQFKLDLETRKTELLIDAARVASEHDNALKAALFMSCNQYVKPFNPVPIKE